MFRDPAAEQAQPTVQERLEHYRPVVMAAVSEDTAYRNACGHSDRENAEIECNAAVRRAVLNSKDMELIQLKFRVTPQEREMIETKMAQFGTTNMAAYLRKMAIDGYVVKLDLPELRELVSLLRYSSNNLNQLTRRAHETGRIYEADLEDIQQSQERIWTAAEKIISSLAALK